MSASELVAESPAERFEREFLAVYTEIRERIQRQKEAAQKWIDDLLAKVEEMENPDPPLPRVFRLPVEDD